MPDQPDGLPARSNTNNCSDRSQKKTQLGEELGFRLRKVLRPLLPTDSLMVNHWLLAFTKTLYDCFIDMVINVCMVELVPHTFQSIPNASDIDWTWCMKTFVVHDIRKASYTFSLRSLVTSYLNLVIQ